MAIQDEMYKKIEQEINLVVREGQERVLVDIEKAKLVAKTLTSLSVDKDAESSGVINFMAKINTYIKTYGNK